jgi:hypothetical protein
MNSMNTKYFSLPRWGRAGVGASGVLTRAAQLHAPSALIPAFSQREKGQNPEAAHE